MVGWKGIERELHVVGFWVGIKKHVQGELCDGEIYDSRQQIGHRTPQPMGGLGSSCKRLYDVSTIEGSSPPSRSDKRAAG